MAQLLYGLHARFQSKTAEGPLLNMGLAKTKLGSDFNQVAQHVPGVENLIHSAPNPQAAGSGSSGAVLGARGGLLGGKSGGAGSPASLAGGFQQLGLSPGMIGKFLPVVLNFLQSKGGPQTRGRLEHALA